MNSKVNDEDRLASLPDSTLLHILSFLPTLDAVRTMLIKSFGTLWTALPNLDLNDQAFDMWSSHCPDHNHVKECHDDDNDDDENPCSSVNWAFFVFVHNILIRHNSPKLVKFRVNISADVYYSDIQKCNLEQELDSWIDFALRKHVEVLEFNVGIVEPCEPLYKLPHAEFVSDSLTELKLEFLEMKLQKRVQMRSLRVLRLIRVDIIDDVFKEIIRGCPVLQELEIYNCASLDELKFDVPNVERVVIDTAEQYKHVLRINCPKLASFHYTGSVECVEIQDLSSVVEIHFDLGARYLEWKEFQEFMAVLNALLSAKVVSFSCEFITVLFYCMLKHPLQTVMNWKQAKLGMWMTEKHIPGLCRLLNNSPCLEELQIEITDWQRDFLVPIESELDTGSLEGEEDFSWASLKSITIRNVSMCLYPVLVRLVEILLKNAAVLDDLAICYKSNDQSMSECILLSDQWAEFSDKLPTFPKASEHVKFWLV